MWVVYQCKLEFLNQEEFKFGAKSFIITPAGQMNDFIQINPQSKGFIGTFNDTVLFNHPSSHQIGIDQNILSLEKFTHFHLDECKVST